MLACMGTQDGAGMPPYWAGVVQAALSSPHGVNAAYLILTTAPSLPYA